MDPDVDTRQSGFTVVEMITVIVVLGILSLGTVRFLTDTGSGFASAVSRADLAADARSLVNRLSGDLREALPGSIRVAGGCLEYLPIVAAGRYLTLPVGAPASTFRSVPVQPLPLPPGARAAVHVDGAAYAMGDPGAISPVVALSAPDANNVVTVSMAAAHRFPGESPAQRYFLVTDPVSVCADGGNLYRYTGYGVAAAQPGPADLPATLPGRVLLASGVTSPAPFSLSGANLTRNAVVALDLTLAGDGDTVPVQHLVQVRNVP